jgi:transcriptional regulator with XRE-family HTH domain
MAILELRAARGWSLKQTADTFLVTPATIAAWLKRIDDQGANALLQLHEPVNKFPDQPFQCANTLKYNKNWNRRVSQRQPRLDKSPFGKQNAMGSYAFN